MLKTAVLPKRLTLEKVGDGEGGGDVDGGGVEITKKLGKSKGQKTSKSQKLARSRKLSKSRKNSSKSGNSPNFGATETGLSFLIPEARSVFNRLRLAFTKAPILRHFNPKYHIRIETDALGYAIGGLLAN